jgi:glycolate oxidase FAD binding subunit
MAECSAVATAVQFEVADAGMRRISVLAEGLPAAIEGKANRIIHTAEGCGAARTGETENAWNSRENLFEGKNICVCKVSLLPTDWAGFLKNTRDLAGRYQIAWKIVGQIFGIGILRLDARQAPQMLEIIAALRNALNECGGTLTVLRCPPAIKQELDVWPDAGDALTLMRSVRRQFDPKGTLSPGRFVGGI